AHHLGIGVDELLVTALIAFDGDRLAVDARHRVVAVAAAQGVLAEHEHGAGHEPGDDDQEADLEHPSVPTHDRDHSTSLSSTGTRGAGAPRSSGTTRRATVMKPVCATMRWNGRTD